MDNKVKKMLDELSFFTNSKTLIPSFGGVDSLSLQSGRGVIIAGRPAEGKTSLLFDFASKYKNLRIAFISGEKSLDTNEYLSKKYPDAMKAITFLTNEEDSITRIKNNEFDYVFIDFVELLTVGSLNSFLEAIYHSNSRFIITSMLTRNDSHLELGITPVLLIKKFKIIRNKGITSLFPQEFKEFITSPLQSPILNNDLEKVKEALELGADPNGILISSNTPVIFAAAVNDVTGETIKALAASGADLNYHDGIKSAFQMLGHNKNGPKIMRLFSELGYTITNEELPYLINTFSQLETTDCLETLFELKPFDPAMTLESGISLLELVVKTGGTPICLKWLLDHGAKILDLEKIQDVALRYRNTPALMFFSTNEIILKNVIQNFAKEIFCSNSRFLIISECPDETKKTLSNFLKSKDIAFAFMSELENNSALLSPPEKTVVVKVNDGILPVPNETNFDVIVVIDSNNYASIKKNRRGGLVDFPFSQLKE